MEAIFSTLAKYLWIIIFVAAWASVPFFLYRASKAKRTREWLESQDFRLIKISVPKENEKGPLAAEQMFASLHGIFRPYKERAKEGSLQEHISFEIASSSEKITFYVWLPVHLKDFVEGQIYAQYPKAEFEEVPDYTERDLSDYHVVGTEIILNKNEVFPIKTFMNFEEVDPLSGITSVLSKIDEQGEDIWIQILAKPVDDSWQERGMAYVNALKSGKAPGGDNIASHASNFLKGLIKAAVSAPEEMATVGAAKIASGDEAKAKAIEEKVTKLGYEVKIRIGYVTKKADLAAAKIKLRSVVGAFKQFNTVNLNGFQAGPTMVGESFLRDYSSRLFTDNGFVLNIEEIASIFHLPNTSVETPRIGWTGSSKGEPPENLPVLEENKGDENIAAFAETNFRHRKYQFGIKTDDRRRHMYIIGKTGVGKTNMMQNMIISDIKAGNGVAVVDPHGELVNSVLEYVPKERINDVIIFDPADSSYPIAFNPLETVDPDQKQLIASGLVSIFHKIWKDSWGPRMEYIMRNTILSLLDYPDSTMMGILRMLVDKNYRRKVIDKLQDPVIYDFWTKEFEQYNESTRVDAILPIQNKVGQFLSSPTIRNIVGQPKSKIDLREIMDNKKILLIRLSQGQIGEDNTALLGAMMITKMQLAAMSRVTMAEEDRQDFYLYVDEFQNFATDSFAKILSEARKYRLDLTVANQYVSQLSEEVRDAIFGNVGSIVSFRIGAADARFLANEFAPVFDENDLVNLDKYHVYLKLSIDGVTGNAFSARTIKVSDTKESNSEKIVRLSREKYANEKALVEEKLNDWASQQEESVKTAALAGRAGEAESKDNQEEIEYNRYSQYLDSLNKNKTSPEGDDKGDKPRSDATNPQVSISNPKNKIDDKKDKLKELTSKITQKVQGEEPLKEELGGLPKNEINQIKNMIDSLRQPVAQEEGSVNYKVQKDTVIPNSHKEIRPGETIEIK